MTFNQFETLIKKHRPDAVVSRHGDFCTKKSGNTLGVYFVKDGHESRVYNYSGSYGRIAAALGVPESEIPTQSIAPQTPTTSYFEFK